MAEPSRALAPLFPPLALAAGLACGAGAAALANCAVLSALLARSINGLSAIIIQLAVADLLLLVTTIGPEMWSYNYRSWIFGNGGCVAYQGLNVFASTASLYLVTTIALHAIATVNLEVKAARWKAKRSTQEEDEEIRSSRHSLVAASSDTSTPPRTMNVDYRRLTDTKILVTRPSMLVWILSASLSVPEFTLATTVPLENDTIVCTLIDSNHRFYMHSLIALFNLFLPIFIMSLAFGLIVVRLKARRTLSEISEEVVSALKLSLCLIIVFVVLCAPRSIVNAYSVYSIAEDMHDSESLIETVKHSLPTDTMTAVNLWFSATYLLALVLRPVLCIILLPCLKQKFTFRCRTSDEENV
ncbi:visual pigment-like receptor peropsin [Cydia splendana]|uniref:visual pigment-like receptor peropsin n=1 Tax=Cydia splendana TaxID=1100963 RepID=UPI00213C3346